MTKSSSTAIEYDVNRGEEAARSYWEHMDNTALPSDPRTPEFANAALRTFIECLKGRSAVDKKVVEGAARSAEQLNVSEFHGINEIIQNADDTGASRVSARIRTVSGRRYLYIVHDGAHVELSEVLPIISPYLTTKDDDPDLKGKFGIGLKTCARFSDRMDVHCSPYHFRPVEDSLEILKPVGNINKFYKSENAHTLFIFRLRNDFNSEEFIEWLKHWDTSSLLFLSSVREFTAQISPKEIFRYQLKAKSIFNDQLIKIKGHARHLSLTSLKSIDGKQRWHRYSVSFKVPKKLKRRYKKTGDDTVVSIGVPTHNSVGRIFVGLPTEIHSVTPILIDAQFDPDQSRERLISSDWNKWLLKRVGDVLTVSTLDLFSRGEPACWNGVPIPSENYEYGDLFWEEFDDVTETIGKEIIQKASVKIGKDHYPLSQIGYCEEHLDSLVDASDIKAIKDGVELLPKTRRDSHGRWRQVLDSYSSAYRISTSKALELFDVEHINKKKSPAWFVELAYHAVINMLVCNSLFSHKSILLANGNQVTPQKKSSATELLLKQSANISFAQQQGVSHQIHNEYGKNNDHAIIVKEYLEEHANLFSSIDAYNCLLIFANKGASTPIEVDDAGLNEIRNLLGQLDKSQIRELGQKLGNAISVDTFNWNGKEKKAQKSRINECYLPSSIEKEKHGWSFAAGRTPGLTWLSARYANIFKTAGNDTHQVKEFSKKHRPLGARAFFHALGAETAPRIQKDEEGWKKIRTRSLTESQEKTFRTFSSYPEGLSGNSNSPDLHKALAVICQVKKKKDRKDRGIALFETLSRSWSRLYSDNTTTDVGHYYYHWRFLGNVPSTWVGQLMDHAWLVNEKGEAKYPENLGLKNQMTLAIYGNAPAFFAANIGNEGDRADIANTIGMETNPKASQIVDLIVKMKEENTEPDEEILRYRYAALARLCPDKAEKLDSQSKVGDLTIAQLRSRFRQKNSSGGLIYSSGSWISQDSAYLGKDIFHGRRIFVSSGKTISPLWKILGIDEPAISVCMEILEEIANGQPKPDDRSILIETYRYIESKLPKASSSEISGLKKIPLQCGDDWLIKRPVYLVPDPCLSAQISNIKNVWNSPGNTTDIRSFMDYAGIELIDSGNMHRANIRKKETGLDITLNYLFSEALQLLGDHLALNCELAYRSLKVQWDNFLKSSIHIDPNLGVDLRLPGQKKQIFNINSYLDLENGIFWFRDEILISEKEDGGRLIWECFGNPQHKENIELTWFYVWSQAQKGEVGTGVGLSMEDHDSDDPLSNIEEAARRAGKKKSKYAKSTKRKHTKGSEQKSHAKYPIRRLKPLSELISSSVAILNPEDNTGGPKQEESRALRGTPSSATKVTGMTSLQTRGRKTYDNNQVEDLALRCLHHVLTTADLGELKDLRKFRNVGADSILELKDYFEIKGSAGDLPSTEVLTRSEFKRAKKEKKNFYLAVITGLEDGFETIVRIYNDPVKTLNWSPASNVIFSGFDQKKHVAISIKDLSSEPINNDN